jgi:seryl-tRNA synthetase
MKTLEEVRVEQQVQARKQFIELIWTDKPDQVGLLRLMGLAGMTTAEADELMGGVEQAKADKKIVDGLPKLREQLAKQQQALDAIRNQQTPIIETAQEAIEAACRNVYEAHNAVETAVSASYRLYRMTIHNEIPESKLPKEIFLIREKEQAEAQRLKIHQEWSDARNLVEKIKIDLDSALRRQNKADPRIGVIGQSGTQKEIADSDVERLKEALAEAKEAFKAATEKAHKSGIDVPDIQM